MRVVEAIQMGAARAGRARTLVFWAMSSLLLSSAACANQTPVIPLLHVEPNAGARIFYFEKRAAAMFAPAGASANSGEVGNVKTEGGGQTPTDDATGASDVTDRDVVLQTWGVPTPASRGAPPAGALPNEPLAIPGGTTSVSPP